MLVGLLFFAMIGAGMMLVMKMCGSSYFNLFDKDIDESVLDEGGEYMRIIDDDERYSHSFYPRSYINIHGETVYIN